MPFTPKSWKDYPDTSTPITASALEDLETRVTSYGGTYVAAGGALPLSPVDGQAVFYVADATAGIVWNLRYRSGSSSSYKWEFVGGGPYTSQTLGDAYNSTWVDGVWGSLTASDPKLTVPLSGDYAVTHTTTMYVGNGTPPGYVGIGIKVGATEPTISGDSSNNAVTTHLGSLSTPSAVLTNHRRITNVGANTELAARYYTSFTDCSQLRSRGASLTVVPIRVG